MNIIYSYYIVRTLSALPLSSTIQSSMLSDFRRTAGVTNDMGPLLESSSRRLHHILAYQNLRSGNIKQ